MTSTVVTPGDMIPPGARVTAGRAVVERPGLLRRFGQFIARRWQWVRATGRAARLRMVFVARRTGSAVSNAASTATTAAMNTGAWIIGAGASLFMYTKHGVQTLGGLAVQGFSYVQYLVAVAWGWFAQTVQGGLFLGALGVLGVIAVVLKVLDWWAESYEYDAKFWRWWSMGKEQRDLVRRGEIKVPYLYRRSVQTEVGTGDPEDMTRRERFMNWFSSVVLGRKVELVEAYDVANDEAIEPGDTIIDGHGAGVGVTSPWTSKGDPRMDDYEGMTLYDVRERHQQRLDYVNDRKDLDEISYWSGRIYFLDSYIEDEGNLSRLEPLYAAWRDRLPKKRGAGPNGLIRGQFRQGMTDERKILREDVALKSPAPADSAGV